MWLVWKCPVIAISGYLERPLTTTQVVKTYCKSFQIWDQTLNGWKLLDEKKILKTDKKFWYLDMLDIMYRLKEDFKSNLLYLLRFPLDKNCKYHIRKLFRLDDKKCHCREVFGSNRSSLHCFVNCHCSITITANITKRTFFLKIH